MDLQYSREGVFLRVENGERKSPRGASLGKLQGKEENWGS